MKKLIRLIVYISLLLISITTNIYAVDQTSRVTAAASKVEAATSSLGIYLFSEINQEDPWDRLCRVTVTFLDINMDSINKNDGDTVNFFIKSSRDAEIGWVDKNANGDFDLGEELDPRAMGTTNGFYVNGAKLTRGSTVTFFVGSQIPGSFDILVYTDNNGQRGNLIGSALPKVEMGKSSIILSAYDEKGISSLSGNIGNVADPYQLIAGDGIELRAAVKLAGTPLKGKTVTFKKSMGLSPYTLIETATTDEDGYAIIRYEARDAGLCSYQAIVNDEQSPEIYIKYSPSSVSYIEAKTIEGKILTQNEEGEIEFYVKDYYGNTIDSKGQDNVEFDIIRSPVGSSFEGYRGALGKSDTDGIAIFKFKPDKPGTYSIRCNLIAKKSSDTIDVVAVKFDKANSLQFSLKDGNMTIPAARYLDSNSDGLPEICGYLEVKRISTAGAVVTSKRYTSNNLIFSSSNTEIVDIDFDGDITVKNKEFRGTVPITVMDTVSKVIGVYNLKIVGIPADIRTAIQTSERKAAVILQYIDLNGNETYTRPGEEYNIIMPTGAQRWNIRPFDSMGKASFNINADEFKTYMFNVLTKESNINKKFQIEFKLAPSQKPIIGARNIIMFIGTKSYSQDGATKITDVAPFIKDGRTFVAVRPIADAFEADVAWNDAKRTVTLTRSDMTVTIIIGSNSIDVVKGGVASTVIADVPAMITDGRTVLPFRAVGDAFGATVNYDAATKAVSYMQ